MPIRFRCHRCYQMLGIASRKAGSQVDCPKCGFSQTVPSEEAAAAALAMDHGMRAATVTETASDLVVYDDEPAPIETPRRQKANEPEPKPTPSKEASADAPAPSDAPAASEALPDAESAAEAEPDEKTPVAGDPVPRGMILFPRQTFYVQGALFVVLAAVTFAAGYFMGRGDANVELRAELEEASKERVLVEGTLLYRPNPNQPEPDERAVVAIFPVRTFPEKKIIVQGIRPSDREPAKTHPSVRAINQLGGVYARADEEGKFDLVVPDKGNYWVLLISAHSARGDGRPVAEPDVEELSNYFTDPELLIGRYKYRLTQEEINSGFNPIELDFDEKKG